MERSSKESYVGTYEGSELEG